MLCSILMHYALFNASIVYDGEIKVNIYIWVFFFLKCAIFYSSLFLAGLLSKCNSHTNLWYQRHIVYLSLSVAADNVCVWREPSQTWGTLFIISVALATANLCYCNRLLIHHLNRLFWLWACVDTRLHVPHVCIYWFPLQTMYDGVVRVCVCPCECFNHAVHAEDVVVSRLIGLVTGLALILPLKLCQINRYTFINHL